MAAGADPYIANYDLPPDDDIEVDTVQPMKDGVTPMDIADLLGDERVCNLNKNTWPVLTGFDANFITI